MMKSMLGTHGRNVTAIHALSDAVAHRLGRNRVGATPKSFSGSSARRDVHICSALPNPFWVARMANRPGPPALRLSSIIAMSMPITLSSL